MKTTKMLLALLLALVMVIGLVGCGSKKEETPADTTTNTTENTTQTGDTSASYTIGHTNLGTGVWVLDLYQTNAQNAADALGMTLNPASANFSADQMVKDIQNQTSSGEDGHLYFAAIGSLTPTVNELFENNEVYWSVFNQMIAEGDLDLVNSNPYYTGSVGTDHIAVAQSLGKAAAEAGLKNALLIAGAVGDTSSDLRIQGFTEAFEAAGGKVVASARCSDPSEAAAKADDLLAAYGDQADCFYGLNMDYILAAIHAAENYNLSGITFFASDCDAEGLSYVKEGTMIAHSNLAIDSVFAMPLVINALDGHKITDADGKAPYYTVERPWVITQETADDYDNYWLKQALPFPASELENQLYRNNPDVSYDSIYSWLEGYNYEYVMSFVG